MPIRSAAGRNQEFDDATLLSNGDVIFSHMSGAAMVSPEKKILWDYRAPSGTEIHSCQTLGKDRVLLMRNGNPAQAMIINTATGKVEKEIPIPTPITSTHGQFRHIRMTKAGTLLVPHLGEGKVVEYDLDGKVLWSVAAKSPWQAVRLSNGNTLIAGDWSRYAREVNPKGETVWEFTKADLPGHILGNIQTADRLANGNTVMCCWIAGDNNTSHWPGTIQVLEVTPEKKIVWAMSSWKDPVLVRPLAFNFSTNRAPRKTPSDDCPRANRSCADSYPSLSSTYYLMKHVQFFLAFLAGGWLVSSVALGENPLVTDIFTADPSGRVFNGRLYVYTSHDLPDATYWDMVDWRLLSTADLVAWKDHGSIFHVKDFAWASRWAWAPDCVESRESITFSCPWTARKLAWQSVRHQKARSRMPLESRLLTTRFCPTLALSQLILRCFRTTTAKLISISAAENRKW